MFGREHNHVRPWIPRTETRQLAVYDRDSSPQTETALPPRPWTSDKRIGADTPTDKKARGKS